MTQIHVSGLSVDNLDSYLKITPDKVATEFANPDKIKAFNEMLDSMPADQKAYYKFGVDSIVDGAEHAALNGVAKGLNKLGLVGGVLGLMFAANDATAAELSGNSEQAKEIMKLWALDAAGSEIASIIGATLGGIAVAALGVVGVTLSAPLAGALVFGAALVGGLYGGDATTGLYHWLKDPNAKFADLGGIKFIDQLALEIKNGLISALQSAFHTAEATISPLILDLDGDGVETISKSVGIHFDHNGNHFSETTGWVGKDDGLLVLDRNGNGKIDNGGELFGNNTQLTNGNKAANGFAALVEFDSNHDGKINASDTAFNQLRVWKDSDSNGVVSNGELLSLDTAGVQSLSTAYTTQNQTDAQGNQHLQAGQYTRIDNSTGAVDDVWFATDTARSIDQDLVAVNDTIAALPELQGFGNVHSLHQAMARDTSGHLQNLVKNFVNAIDSATRFAVFQEILFAWTGSDQYSITSRGSYIEDGRKLYTLEAFLAENFVQGDGLNAGTNEPGPNAAARLIDVYNNLSKTLYGQLVGQTDQIHNLHDNIGFSWDAVTGTFGLDLTMVVSSLQSAYAANANAGLDLLRDFGASLASEGSFGSDVLSKLREIGNVSGQGFNLYLGMIGYNQIAGGAGNDIINGLSDTSNGIVGLDGNDTINGGDKNDVLNGGAGNDLLSDGYGNDMLAGGVGNDTVNGGYGSDTFVFNLGDGIDTISDYDFNANSDKLQFGAGITADAIQLGRNGNDLILNVNASDKVTLQNYFYFDSSYRIETITFADGPAWDYATVTGKLVYNGTANADTLTGASGVTNRINGLDGNDTINGDDKDDVLNGDAGNDSLSGNNGNDMLTGGAGNDTVNGGYGSDTYAFNLGDGADTISDYDYNANSDKLQFGAGITADAIQLGRNGSDLILSVNASDKVTLQNYFYSSSYRIETITFADGTTWDYATVADKLVYNGTANADTLTGTSDVTNRINGLDGNDTINGGDKSDVLSGGAGNDIVNGGYGSDTYAFNVGDGADTISDYDYNANSDKLQFGAGITADAIQLGRNGSDLILSVNASDKVTLQNYFYSSSYRIETIAFADGTTWDYATVAGKLVYNGTANADTLSGVWDATNRINGLDGNDTINGGDKDDVLNGDAGNDSLSGNSGNDMLIGGAGNDALNGGSGNDIFKFITPDQGTDSISDFASGADVIQIVGSNFGLQPGVGVSLLTGTATPSASGTAPQFLYNTTTGALYFDQDGAGSAYNALSIVTLTGQKNLAVADIVVM